MTGPSLKYQCLAQVQNHETKYGGEEDRGRVRWGQSIAKKYLGLVCRKQPVFPYFLATNNQSVIAKVF